MKRFYKEKENQWILVFLISFSIFMFVMQNLNGRFWLNDFKVYYSAAKGFVEGTPIYGIPHGLGSGFFKYSPVSLLFFVPFTFLPFYLAATIYFFLIIILFFFLYKKIIKLFDLNHQIQKKFLFFILFFTVVIVHFVRELHLGNINLILLLLVVCMLLNWQKKSILLGAICFTIIVLTKPYLMLIGLPLLFLGKWKEIIYCVGTTFFAVIISFLIIGFSKSAILYPQWFESMLQHSEGLTSQNTIGALFETFFGFTISTNASILLLVISAIIIVSYLFILSKKQGRDRSFEVKFFTLSTLIVFALLPNFLITDTEHFLYTSPLILLITFHFKKYSLIEKTLFIVALFLYSFSPFKDFGSLGIGNLLLVSFSIYQFGKLNFYTTNLKHWNR